MEIKPVHKASCHCGAVEFELTLPNGIDPHRCDCSICRMHGAIISTVRFSELKITEGKSNLTLYQFNTMTAKHYFCSICGIYTHHQLRSNPQEYDFNLACLEGVNPLELENVPTHDGINHSLDQ